MLRKNVLLKIKQLLIDTLSLDIQTSAMDDDLALLGNLPEFDSMAIVSIITSIEEEFDFMVDDDDLNAEVFESVGSLVDFVIDKQLNRV